MIEALDKRAPNPARDLLPERNADWSADVTTRNGYAFHVRPASPADEDALAEFFTHVGADDLRFRFLSAIHKVGHDQLKALVNVDHERTENFLAIERDAGRIIATAMMATDHTSVNAEIETADHSTLIVPNSELITKTVRNMTHASPMGVVQLKFTVPLDTDVDAVKDLVLSLFARAEAVFDDPEPKVFIDSVGEGAAHFHGIANFASPRAAYATRSDVLFRLIMELRKRGIALGSSGTTAVATNVAPAGTAVMGDDR